MNGTANVVETADNNEAGAGETEGGFGYGLVFSFGIVLFIIVLSYVSYICKRRLHYRSQPPPPPLRFSYPQTTGDSQLIGISTGIKEDVLVNFPTLLYSEAKPHFGDGDGSGCAICLADYKPADMLRLLPECGHLFHLTCIDTWLKLHTTCPVCRNSPLPTPLVEVVPLSVHR